MRFVPWLMHRHGAPLAWFVPTQTKYGQTIPARLGKRTIGFLALLPFSVLLTIVLEQPWFLMANGVILALVVVDDWYAAEWFLLGVDAGRRETIAEMIMSWSDQEITANQWLMREAELIKETEKYSPQ